MMDMIGGMGVMMLVAVLVFAIVIGVAIYLAVRAAHRPDRRDPDAREMLQHRLAAGEITADEYYERDSVLRESQSKHRRR